MFVLCYVKDGFLFGVCFPLSLVVFSFVAGCIILDINNKFMFGGKYILT